MFTEDMTYYLTDYRVLKVGDWFDLYTRYQGQSDEELARGAEAYFVGRRKVKRVDAENLIYAVSDIRQTDWQTIARGYHQIGEDNIRRRR